MRATEAGAAREQISITHTYLLNTRRIIQKFRGSVLISSQDMNGNEGGERERSLLGTFSLAILRGDEQRVGWLSNIPLFLVPL